jgi:chemotaxis protein MotB
MSTVAMVLFFLMLLSYIQNILTGHKLSFARDELAGAEERLAGIQATLEGTMGSLSETQAQLDQTRASLAETEKEITDKEHALALLQDEIEQTRAEVEEGQRELALSQAEIEDQRQVIAMSNQELGDLRAKLSDIAVLRVDILQKVRDSIESKIGKYGEDGQERVTIGPNANIVINEQLVFDYGSAEVKPEAQQLLTQLAVAFEELLADEQVRGYIDYISIEGHTDSVGTADYNRTLSAERAVAVVNYMMDSNPALERDYARYFGIGGFSKFRPLTEGTDELSMAQNRRIEISVVVKDESIRNIIEEYLGGAPTPAAGQASPSPTPTAGAGAAQGAGAGTAQGAGGVTARARGTPGAAQAAPSSGAGAEGGGGL